jgi:hypothetical protein
MNSAYSGTPRARPEAHTRTSVPTDLREIRCSASFNTEIRRDFDIWDESIIPDVLSFVTLPVIRGIRAVVD